ncbi:MAG: hypothetical protein AAGI17_01415 [Planctomycetota bacterium]
MTRSTILVAGVAASACFLSAAVAQPVLIDFDTDGNGATLLPGQGFDGDTAYAALGVMIDVQSPRQSPLNLFDTQNPTGGDADLATGAAFGTPELGNVLIIQEIRNNPISIPDDDVRGGEITFSFDQLAGVTVNEIALLDLDENRLPTFTLELISGQTVVVDNMLGSLLNPAFPGNNSLRTYDLSAFGAVSSVGVEFNRVSGAIASLEFTPGEIVPAPGTAALCGLGGLVAVRRGRRRV